MVQVATPIQFHPLMSLAWWCWETIEHIKVGSSYEIDRSNLSFPKTDHFIPSSPKIDHRITTQESQVVGELQVLPMEQCEETKGLEKSEKDIGNFEAIEFVS